MSGAANGDLSVLMEAVMSRSSEMVLANGTGHYGGVTGGRAGKSIDLQECRGWAATENKTEQYA